MQSVFSKSCESAQDGAFTVREQRLTVHARVYPEPFSGVVLVVSVMGQLVSC